MVAQTRRWLFTVDDFARMAQSGILGEDDRVELVGGEVVSMTPIGPLHNGIVSRLNRLLLERLGRTVSVAIQSSVRLDEHNEPEPDVSVMRFRADDYDRSLPIPGDILLLAEVADSSLEFGRDEKIPHYAEASIPEVWLIDAQGETITQYTCPTGKMYADIRTLAIGRTVECQSIPGFRVTVAEVLRSQAESKR